MTTSDHPYRYHDDHGGHIGLPLNEVTRVEVIDNNGRVVVRSGLNKGSVDVHLQDDGRTLKVFVNGGLNFGGSV